MTLTPEQMLANTRAYLANLEKAKRGFVAVGLPSEEVGSKVYGSIVQPGATYTMTDADKADEHNGKRIKNAIASGNLERV